MPERMKTLADQVRSSHDAQALATYMDREFLPAEEISLSGTCRLEHYIEKMPADLDQRIQALSVSLASAEESYQKDYVRYSKIRNDGLNALTDLEIAYFGSCNPIMAVRSPLLILGSHIASGKAKIPFLRQQLAECRQARAIAGEQLAMF